MFITDHCLYASLEDIKASCNMHVARLGDAVRTGHLSIVGLALTVSTDIGTKEDMVLKTCKL